MMPRLRSGLLLALALVACEAEGPDVASCPSMELRELDEKDVLAWLAVTQDLAWGKGPEPIDGRFSSQHELLSWVEGRREEFEPVCSEWGISARDYVAIGRSIESCRTIRAGQVADAEREMRLESTLPMGPGRPPADSGVPLPPDPPLVAPPVVSLEEEASIPGVPGRNLDVYDAYQDEIERVLALVESVEGGDDEWKDESSDPGSDADR